jgi:Xaa-Pro aminopeptidase
MCAMPVTKDEAKRRTQALQSRLHAAGVEIAIVTDESSIAYLAGFWGYLNLEFGRLTFLLLHYGEPPIVITPRLEVEMVRAMTWIDDVRPYDDAGQHSWDTVLAGALGMRPGRIGAEVQHMPAMESGFLQDRYRGVPIIDVGPAIAELRMVKSPEELAIMRQAGEVGAAMMAAAEESIAENVPEYETALALMAAGTRKAAELLTDETLTTPLIHDLVLLQSGAETAMLHRRAGMRRYERGDPVHVGLAGALTFRHYRLGMDRTFFLGEVNDEGRRLYETALAAEQAALATLKPGAHAEDAFHAAEAVLREAGLKPADRIGRGIGLAPLEPPQLKAGDRTLIKENMTFVVNTGLGLQGRLGGRIGDSVVVTASGAEYLTDYPRELRVLGG